MPEQSLILNRHILEAALEGLEIRRARIDDEMLQIRHLLGSGNQKPGTMPSPRKRRKKMSAASRKRIAEAQRRRWAAHHKALEAPSPTKPIARAGARKKA